MNKELVKSIDLSLLKSSLVDMVVHYNFSVCGDGISPCDGVVSRYSITYLVLQHKK